MRRSLLLTLVVLCAVAGAAGAATITRSGYAPLHVTSDTDWADTIKIQQFRPYWGTLTSLSIQLDGRVWGYMGFEHTGTSQPAPEIKLKLSADILVLVPSTAISMFVAPAVVTTDLMVPKFDGVIDFGGPPGIASGRMYYSMSMTQTDGPYMRPPPAADLAVFTGLGYLYLPVTAEGKSVGSGSGNLISVFNTNAEAWVTVVYEYEPTPRIPEMGSLVLAGLGGFVGLPFWRRMRK